MILDFTPQKTEIRKIIHIDMDAFFAAIEIRDNPSLIDKPVIVGGPPNSRGVVSTCNYIARKYGIHSAMPSFQAYRLCPHAVFVRSRFEAYREASRQMMEIFYKYTDMVQAVSIDEAYLDVTENKLNIPSATWIAEKIRAEIEEVTKVTASAGVSYNKFLAKIASEMNKPDGLMVIPPDKATEIIENLPIGKFHGIGKSTETKMKYLGINNGADLKKLPIDKMILNFGKAGVFYYNIVRGIDPRKVHRDHIRKSISTERTFREDISGLPELMLALEQTTNRLADRMAEKDIAGKTISIKVKYNDFTLINRSATVKNYTNNRDKIFRLARRLFNDSWAAGRKVRLIGVCITSLDTDEASSDQMLAPFFNTVAEETAEYDT